MSHYLHPAGARLDYAVDYAASIGANGRIIHSRWSFADADAAIVIADHGVIDRRPWCIVTGGSAGALVRLINHVTLADGRMMTSELALRIGEALA